MLQLDQEYSLLVKMVSRLAFMVVVWGFLSFQGVLRISAARPVFDVTGISWERSGQNFQHNLKSTGCKDGTGTTFAVESNFSGSSQVGRVLVDSSCVRGRQLRNVEPPSPPNSDPGINDPPGSG